MGTTVLTKVVVRDGAHAAAALTLETAPMFDEDVMGVTVGVTAGTVIVPDRAGVGWTTVWATTGGIVTCIGKVTVEVAHSWWFSTVP